MARVSLDTPSGEGGASFALNCGVPSDYIKLQDNWKLTAYERYLDHSLRYNLEAVKQMSQGINNSPILSLEVWRVPRGGLGNKDLENPKRVVVYLFSP